MEIGLLGTQMEQHQLKENATIPSHFVGEIIVREVMSSGRSAQEILASHITVMYVLICCCIRFY